MRRYNNNATTQPVSCPLLPTAPPQRPNSAEKRQHLHRIGANTNITTTNTRVEHNPRPVSALALTPPQRVERATFLPDWSANRRRSIPSTQAPTAENETPMKHRSSFADSGPSNPSSARVACTAHCDERWMGSSQSTGEETAFMLPQSVSQLQQAQRETEAVTRGQVGSGGTRSVASPPTAPQPRSPARSPAHALAGHLASTETLKEDSPQNQDSCGYHIGLHTSQVELWVLDHQRRIAREAVAHPLPPASAFLQELPEGDTEGTSHHLESQGARVGHLSLPDAATAATGAEHTEQLTPLVPAQSQPLGHFARSGESLLSSPYLHATASSNSNNLLSASRDLGNLSVGETLLRDIVAPAPTASNSNANILTANSGSKSNSHSHSANRRRPSSVGASSGINVVVASGCRSTRVAAWQQQQQQRFRSRSNNNATYIPQHEEERRCTNLSGSPGALPTSPTSFRPLQHPQSHRQRAFLEAGQVRRPRTAATPHANLATPWRRSTSGAARIKRASVKRMSTPELLELVEAMERNRRHEKEGEEERC